MNASYIKAISRVEAVIAELDREISEGRFDEAPRAQLESFRRAFSEMKHVLRCGGPPEKNFGVSRAVVDSWSHSSALGLSLIEAEHAYLSVRADLPSWWTEATAFNLGAIWITRSGWQKMSCAEKSLSKVVSERNALFFLLKEKGVNPDAVSVGMGVPQVDEMYCLVKDGACWEVYYAERGQKVDLEVFESENKACDYLYDVLKLDSSVWV